MSHLKWPNSLNFHRCMQTFPSIIIILFYVQSNEFWFCFSDFFKIFFNIKPQRPFELRILKRNKRDNQILAFLHYSMSISNWYISRRIFLDSELLINLCFISSAYNFFKLTCNIYILFLISNMSLILTTQILVVIGKKW